MSNEESHSSSVSMNELFESKPNHQGGEVGGKSLIMPRTEMPRQRLKFVDNKVQDFPVYLNRRDFDDLLMTFLQEGVDDVDLSVCNPLMIKLKGSWVPVSDRAISYDEVSGIVDAIDNSTATVRMMSQRYLQFAHAIRTSTEQYRYRVNGTKILGAGGAEQAASLTLRIIPGIPPTTSELKLPSQISKMVEYSSGLFVVCGSTGSGKTTTCAALIRYILETRDTKIITFEDPIEYVYDKVEKRGFIQQSEIQWFEKRWKDVLPNARRRNPDVIFLGEAQDKDAMETTVKSASDGKFVMVTLHAGTVVDTIHRMAKDWPVAEQPDIIKTIIANIRGIVHQRLVRTPDSRARTPIFGILEFTQDIRDHLGGLNFSDLRQAISEYVDSNGVSEMSDAQLKFDRGLVHPDDFEKLKRDFKTDGS
ncbi:ATPase, T2SS/T4P/T4SS family [Porticoccaceae bacterium]|nr:ATPase, T2SS/T4P/T4SS family [Porticoccaceae bacterium]MDB2664399.1 ATPase, T2SS/T4P/T4SS family [Porticoccaceae bacterium]